MKIGGGGRTATGGVALYACIPPRPRAAVADVLKISAGSSGISVSGGEVDFDGVASAGQGDQDARRRRRLAVQEERGRLVEGAGTLTSDANVKVGDRELRRQGDPGHRLGVQARGGWSSAIAFDTAGAWLLESQTRADRGFGLARRRRDRLGLRSAGHRGARCSRFSIGAAHEDADISKLVARGLAKQNIEILTGTSVDDVKAGKEGVKLKWADREAEVDYVCIAAGRGADVEGLGLDDAGVRTGDDGLVEVDGAMRTSRENVYAIGDLVPGPALAHKASDEGVIAVEDAAGRQTHPLSYPDIPRATFCTPNVASFGLTEQQARDEGHDVTVGKVQYGAVGAGTVYATAPAWSR